MSEIRTSVSASLVIPASSREEGRIKAASQFNAFFGHTDYTITSESAEADVFLFDGTVLSWKCSLEAVALA